MSTHQLINGGETIVSDSDDSFCREYGPWAKASNGQVINSKGQYLANLIVERAMDLPICTLTGVPDGDPAVTQDEVDRLFV
jgi:hypothetical protein